MMDPNVQHSDNEAEYRKRDSESFLMLGAFLVVLAVIVLLATVFQAPGHARVVNGVAGLALVTIGAAMTLWGMRLRRPANTP